MGHAASDPNMDMPGATRPGPYAAFTKIPRCPDCWEHDGVITPNPKALDHCVRCGTLAPARATIRVGAKINGISGYVIAFGFWLRSVGQFFTNLAESMRDDDGR